MSTFCNIKKKTFWNANLEIWKLGEEAANLRVENVMQFKPFRNILSKDPLPVMLFWASLL